MVKKLKRRKPGRRRADPSAGPFLHKLDQVEAELRSLGWWRVEALDPFAHLGPDDPRSYLDASSFEDWLQFVFLPNARGGAVGGTLPTASHVGLMAEEQYDSRGNLLEARRLISLLAEFDELVMAHHARKG